MLLVLFGWQSLAAAMALPCRFESRSPAEAHAHHAGHAQAMAQATAHADHCAKAEPGPAAQHDCDGLCADRHCAGVALAVPSAPAFGIQLPLTRIDALFTEAPPRSAAASELIRPPSLT